MSTTLSCIGLSVNPAQGTSSRSWQAKTEGLRGKTETKAWKRQCTVCLAIGNLRAYDLRSQREIKLIQ